MYDGCAVCGISSRVSLNLVQRAAVALSHHFCSTWCSLWATADFSSMPFIPFIIGHCAMDSLPICMCWPTYDISS
jgi:hypothetical protein